MYNFRGDRVDEGDSSDERDYKPKLRLGVLKEDDDDESTAELTTEIGGLTVDTPEENVENFIIVEKPEEEKRDREDNLRLIV